MQSLLDFPPYFPADVQFVELLLSKLGSDKLESEVTTTWQRLGFELTRALTTGARYEEERKSILDQYSKLWLSNFNEPVTESSHDTFSMLSKILKHAYLNYLKSPVENSKKIVANISSKYKIRRKVELQKFMDSSSLHNFGERFSKVCSEIDAELKEYDNSKYISVYEDAEIPSLKGIEINISIPKITLNESIELTDKIVEKIANKDKSLLASILIEVTPK